jgi:hypothetical protein
MFAFQDGELLPESEVFSHQAATVRDRRVAPRK